MPDSRNGATVLNVDDDTLGRYAVSQLLERAGYAVVEAGTGAEALQRMAEHPVDVVVLDIHLPDMDGLEVARRLKADPDTEAIPILHLSATARGTEAVARALASGGDAYLTEPVAPEVLLATVAALARMRRAVREAEKRGREAAQAVAAREEAERAQGRLAAEAEQQRSLLDTVLSSMPAGVVNANSSGQVIRANPPAQEMTGGAVAPPAQIGHYPGLRAFHPDGREFTPDDWHTVRALRRGEATRGEEMVLERPDGSRLTIIASAAPIRGPEGNIVASVVVFYDISERQQAAKEREALLAEMQRWRTLLDAVLHQMPSGVIVLNAGAERVLSNEEAARLSPIGMHRSVREAFEHGLTLRRPDGTRYAAEELPALRALEGEVVADEEIRFTSRSGEEVIVSVRAAPLRGGEGEISGSVTLLHEVTAERQAREELEHQARLLESLIETTDYWLAYLDRDLRFVHVNSAFAAKSRFSREEMVGKHYLEVFPTLLEAYSLYERARDTGETVSMQELPTTVPDRPEWGTVYITFSIAPVKDANGTVEGVVFSAQDVTEEVQARQRVEAAERAWADEAQLLDTIQEHTDHWLAYLDRELRFVRVNRALARAMGRPREWIVGRDFAETFPDGSDLRQTLAQVLARGKARVFRALPRRMAGGAHRDWHHLNLSLLPVRDANGTVQGLVFSALDVTAQVRQRQQLVEVERARADLAEHLNDEIAHRVKNNLAMVSGLLQMQAIRQPHPGLSAVLRDSVARVRTFANIHEQMYTGQSDEVDLLEAVRKIAETNREVFAAAGGLEIDASGERTLCISRTATNLSVVANELITNALKHGGPGADGRRRIELHVGREGESLVLEVWNSGPPVPEGFDATEQSGMGLLLVLDLMGEYGGAFTLTPDRDGTLARITLPVSVCSREAPERQEAA